MDHEAWQFLRFSPRHRTVFLPIFLSVSLVSRRANCSSSLLLHDGMGAGRAGLRPIRRGTPRLLCGLQHCVRFPAVCFLVGFDPHGVGRLSISPLLAVQSRMHAIRSSGIHIARAALLERRCPLPFFLSFSFSFPTANNSCTTVTQQQRPTAAKLEHDGRGQEQTMTRSSAGCLAMQNVLPVQAALGCTF